jgi:hypothetical protein
MNVPYGAVDCRGIAINGCPQIFLVKIERVRIHGWPSSGDLKTVDPDPEKMEAVSTTPNKTPRTRIISPQYSTADHEDSPSRSKSFQTALKQP